LSSEYAIVADNLTKKFSKFVALDNLNLKIKNNLCVGYLGPNGSGKTTTIKILTGLLRPTEGNTSLSGYDVRQNKPAALQNVGVVMENPIFPGNVTPEEVLRYFGKLRGMPKDDIVQRTSDVLSLVKLDEWRKKKIGNFSKGMKQRIAIASSLLHDPDILILDEPMSGLDPGGIIEIRNIINSLKKENKTIFLSSHLLGEIHGICDEVAILDKGNLLQHVSVKEIANVNKTEIKIDLVSAPIQSQLEQLENISGVSQIKQDGSSLVLKFEGSIENRAEFHKKLHDIGLKIISFKTVQSDLESLYMQNISEEKKNDTI